METGTRQNTEHIDVSYVAHLARLHLADSEIQVFQKQLDHILQHVHMLTHLDVDHVEPTAHAMPVENAYREDDIRPCLSHDEVMDNAPNGRGGLFIVPKIIE